MLKPNINSTKMRWFLYTIFTAVLLCSFFIPACQIAPITPLTPSPPTTSLPTTPTTLFSTVPTTVVPAISGILHLDSSDPMTLDPAVSADSRSTEYLLQIFSGLVRLDDKLMPAADIAHRCDLSNGGKTYTFYLRSDVKFHNGRDVKALDFKYSWDRACDPKTKSKTASDYLIDIIGAKDVLSGHTKEISGVKVIDEYTLAVTIDSPKAYFLHKLTGPAAFVVDKDNVASGKDWWRKPNGTGPFRLKQWEKEESLILDRNPTYYGEQSRIEAVNFRLLSGRTIDLYENGTIDVAELSSLYYDRVEDKTSPVNNELCIVPELSFYGIGFNMTKAPFDDINIRLAFSHAIDRNRLVALAFQGRMQCAAGILPPEMPGYNKSLRSLEFNIARAKELIAKSQYADRMPPITMTCSGWSGQIERLVTAVIHDWQQNLGIEVTVRQILPDRFTYHCKEEKDELFTLNWGADYPHPQNFLETLFRTGAERNYGGYSNTEVDALLNKAANELDYNTSLMLYQQVEQKLISEAACLPLRFGQNYVLIKPYVKGYTINSMGHTQLNKVTIEPHWKFSGN